ncbi:MAG: T9SS type A sorting domain-containing protein [Ignavibacteriales bacterium]|nr:MAG: T9SS type A sorting domain-containing protein [Ignavibacteriales bacterium]
MKTLILFLVIFSGSFLFSQTTIVEWNFPNSPDDSLADAGIPPNALKIISPVGTTGSITYPAGFTTQSISTTGWTDGLDTKYWMIEFSTSLYSQLTVSSRQQSSNTGPRDFKIQYRVGLAGTWTDLAGTNPIIVANNFTLGVVNEIPLPAVCDDQPSVFLRWIMISNNAVTGGVVAGTGTSRIDNIQIVSALNEPMPVELISFTGSVIENSVVLKWQTATETNNYGFEIERKILKQARLPVGQVQNDNSGWERIGFVIGNGNINSPVNYFYEDKSVSSGYYSYRLKQIDFDGKYAYSNVIELELSKPNNFSLEQNYPNPFNPLTTIEFSLREPSFVTIKIFNAAGEEVATILKEQKSEGDHKIIFDGSNFASGIYFYTLSDGSGISIKKMQLLK